MASRGEWIYLPLVALPLLTLILCGISGWEVLTKNQKSYEVVVEDELFGDTREYEFQSCGFPFAMDWWRQLVPVFFCA